MGGTELGRKSGVGSEAKGQEDFVLSGGGPSLEPLPSRFLPGEPLWPRVVSSLSHHQLSLMRDPKEPRVRETKGNGRGGQAAGPLLTPPEVLPPLPSACPVGSAVRGNRWGQESRGSAQGPPLPSLPAWWWSWLGHPQL